MTLTARLYIATISCAGSAVLVWNVLRFHPDDAIRFACYLFLAIMASGLKVRLPAITGTMSVNFFFILLGIVELSPSETVLIGCTSVAVQCIWRTRTRAKAIQVLFNISANALAVAAAELVYLRGQELGIGTNLPVLVMITASVYFVVNTLSIAGVKAQAESLDTLGILARSVEDVRLLAAALVGGPAASAAPARGGAPRLAYCRSPHWPRAEPATIAEAPSMPTSGAVRCMEPPLPPQQPVARPYSSANMPRRSPPLAM